MAAKKKKAVRKKKPLTTEQLIAGLRGNNGHLPTKRNNNGS